MAISVTNQIKNAIMEKLKQEFPDYKRYGEEIKQGFQAPCFFLAVINTSSKQKMIGKRYQRTISLDVHFFPAKQENQNEQMYDMRDLLYLILEVLHIDGQILRGSEMNYEIVDGVLHFFVDYKVFVYREVVKDPVMEDLNIERAVLRVGNRNEAK